MAGERVDSERLLQHLRDTPDAALDQWLSCRTFQGFRFIAWIRIARETQGFAVYQKNSLDGGDPKLIDLDEFLEIGDPDLPEGKRDVFESAEAAIEFAVANGASRERFVTRGGLSKEYLDLINREGMPAFGALDWIVEG